MLKKKKRESVEVNASSMADIAFLLLVFFLVTTQIVADRGLRMTLPPKGEIEEEVKIHDRNVFKVLINSQDKLLVENKPMDIAELKERAKEFITNNGRNPELSDSPKDAIVSFKGDRGTTYATYIEVVDLLKAAYNELHAAHLGITLEEFLELDPTKPEDAKQINKAREAIPPQLSEAEPIDL